MFGIDLTLWNRVSYPERKGVMKIVSNAGIVLFVSGLFAITVTWPVSKLVELFAA